MIFGDLPRNNFGVVLADPPWDFKTYSKKGRWRSAERHYATMSFDEIAALPVHLVTASDCVLFLWATWPMLQDALTLVRTWGFSYKTCAFDWMKAHVNQIDMFRDDADALMSMGFWTRSNSEPCLLATKGKPKRKTADVRMGIIEPRREHSRKPSCVHKRIEWLVDGPYLELFARQEHPGWTTWGNETMKFPQAAG